MPRRLRYVPPGGALVEVTCRTLQARFLLRPTPLLREITLGILGRAQRNSGMAVHAFVFLANHYHLLVSVTDAAQLAKFVGYLNSNLAREVSRLHAWKEKVWGRRYQAILVSGEEEAQIERLFYLARQGCKEGLVADPLEWPGATSWRAMLDNQVLEGIWFDRTAECLARRNGIEFGARDFASPEPVVLTPLPTWARLAPEVQRERLRDLLDLARAEAAAMRQETGRDPVGREAVVRQDPHGSPARSKKGPAPLVHAASREARRAYREAYRLFTAAYRRAAEALRAGVEAVAFPEGCFPPPGPFLRPATA
ncbi:MAG: transposase [Thermoanaerobaculia bacterium]|nr:transposase [Thermoanaerobaculia bacterium]